MASRKNYKVNLPSLDKFAIQSFDEKNDMPNLINQKYEGRILRKTQSHIQGQNALRAALNSDKNLEEK